jgi:ribonuclease G
MTRKKVRERFGELLQKECSYCQGSGKVMSPETMVLKVMRMLRRMVVDDDFKKIKLELHPDVAHALKTPHNRLVELNKELNRNIKVKRNPEIHIEEINILEKK